MLNANVATNDNDPDGDDLTFTVAVNPTNGILTLNTDGTFSYQPSTNYFGSDFFVYEVADGNGGSNVANVTIVITSVNDSPLAEIIPNQTNGDGTFVSTNVSGQFMDPERSVLTYTATGLPPGLAITSSSGLISGEVDKSASQHSPYLVSVMATDTGGAHGETSFMWTITNPPPVVANDHYTILKNSVLRASVAENDYDPDGDLLLYSIVTMPTNGTLLIGAAGSIEYTPATNYFGSDAFIYKVNDGNGGIRTGIASIAILYSNQIPTTLGFASQIASDNSVVSLNVSNAFLDPDMDLLIFSATNLPPGLTINPNTGYITGTVDRSASRGTPYNVILRATDPIGSFVETFFTWTVTNPAPTAANDIFTILEDAELIGNVSSNASDPDVDALSFAVINHPTNGTITLNTNGAFNYHPNTNFNGTDVFTYRVTDADGAGSTASITISVTPVNDAQVSMGLPDRIDGDGSVVSISVSNIFSDPDGGVLRFISTNLPAGLTINTNTGLIFGSIAKNASQGSPYTVSTRAIDNGGLFVETLFVWSVTNPPPVAMNDTYAILEDTILSGNVSTNDSDPDGDALSFAIVTQATNGSFTLNSNGAFSFQPKTNYNGIDAFTYRVTDTDGASSTASVMVNIISVNDAPFTTGITAQNTFDASHVSLDISAAFNDADGSTLLFSATNLPLG